MWVAAGRGIGVFDNFAHEDALFPTKQFSSGRSEVRLSRLKASHYPIHFDRYGPTHQCYTLCWDNTLLLYTRLSCGALLPT